MVPSIQRPLAKRRFLVLWYFFFSLLIVVSFKVFLGVGKMRFDSTKVNLDLKKGLLLVMSPWGKKESRSDICGKQAKKHENLCFPDSCARETSILCGRTGRHARSTLSSTKSGVQIEPR